MFPYQHRFRLKGSQLGDTLTRDDKVKQQYESLPYPVLGDETLFNEEKYYASNKTFYVDAPSLRLEKLNHFLYRGNENFR